MVREVTWNFTNVIKAQFYIELSVFCARDLLSTFAHETREIAHKTIFSGRSRNECSRNEFFFFCSRKEGSQNKCSRNEFFGTTYEISAHETSAHETRFFFAHETSAHETSLNSLEIQA